MFFKWFNSFLGESVCNIFLDTPAIWFDSLCLIYKYLEKEKHEKQQFINMDILLLQHRCIYRWRTLHPSISLHNMHIALMCRYLWPHSSTSSLSDLAESRPTLLRVLTVAFIPWSEDYWTFILVLLHCLQAHAKYIHNTIQEQ